MTIIKRFIDKIAMAEGRQLREVIIPINDAKELRDEVMKLILDKTDKNKNEVIEVVVKGGKW